jgi:thiamine-monophosphate kinase
MMTESHAEPDATIESIGEFGLIDRLARIVAGTEHDPLRPTASGPINIGDDAALWQPEPETSEVLTTDALVEGVHFRLSTISWRELGWKALAENVSDVAAMGAVPTRAFVTLGLPRGTRVADLDELYQGMADLQAFLLDDGGYDPAIVGGDVVASPVVFLSITVMGELRGPALRRASGKPGDLLAVTGALGGSAGGLALLEASSGPAGSPDARTLVALHRGPEPRVGEGITLAEAGLVCGMDLSDGLIGDASKLAYASGLAATIHADQLPLPPALTREFPNDAVAMALRGGEDFELLVAGPANRLEEASRLLAERNLMPLTIVGRLLEGTPGVVNVVDVNGEPMSVAGGSWDHFRARQDHG